MLKFDTIDMHQNSRIIQLSEILELISDNEFEWSIVDFRGVGHAPKGLTMPEFEDLVRASFLGYRMKWSDLLEFSRSLQQTMECLIVAADSVDAISQPKLKADDYSECQVVIEAIDSTQWTVGVQKSVRMICLDQLRLHG